MDRESQHDMKCHGAYYNSHSKKCGTYSTVVLISKTNKNAVHLSILNEVRSAGE